MALYLLDTTVLSNFAHVRRPDLVQRALGDEAATTAEVMAELRAGESVGAVPACDWRWLRVLQATEEEQQSATELRRHLGPGEATCLAIAQARAGVFLSDDLVARRLARQRGVSVSGTLGVLLRLIETGQLTLGEGDRLLEEMVARGYRAPVRSLGDLLR